MIAAVLFWSGLDILFELRAAPTSRRPRLAASVSGALIGLLGGAVGLILGTLRMPALLRSVGLPAHAAVGTNLVVGFFLGAAGFAAHVVRLEVEWLVLAVSLAGALPGAWLGARYTGRLPDRTLRRLIGTSWRWQRRSPLPHSCLVGGFGEIVAVPSGRAARPEACVLSRARSSFATNAPCVLASERPSHPAGEHHPTEPSC